MHDKYIQVRYYYWQVDIKQQANKMKHLGGLTHIEY